MWINTSRKANCFSVVKHRHRKSSQLLAAFPCNVFLAAWHVPDPPGGADLRLFRPGRASRVDWIGISNGLSCPLSNFSSSLNGWNYYQQTSRICRLMLNALSLFHLLVSVKCLAPEDRLKWCSTYDVHVERVAYRHFRKTSGSHILSPLQHLNFPLPSFESASLRFSENSLNFNQYVTPLFFSVLYEFLLNLRDFYYSNLDWFL